MPAARKRVEEKVIYERTTLCRASDGREIGRGEWNQITLSSNKADLM